MDLIFENWLSLTGFLSAPVMYFLGGRQAKKQELKKGEVEIDSAEIVVKKSLKIKKHLFTYNIALFITQDN